MINVYMLDAESTMAIQVCKGWNPKCHVVYDPHCSVFALPCPHWSIFFSHTRTLFLGITLPEKF